MVHINIKRLRNNFTDKNNKMKKRSTIFIFLLLYIFSIANAKTIKVVTTLPDLKSITELIGGDKVSVTSIATGYQNPHFVDPKPSYIISLTNADMFVTVGLDLETGWSPQLLASSRNTKIQKGSEGYVDASDRHRFIAGSHCQQTGEKVIFIFLVILITGSIL